MKAVSGDFDLDEFTFWKVDVATWLNEKEVGLRTIEKLAGHGHNSTTALYFEVSGTTLLNAMEWV